MKKYLTITTCISILLILLLSDCKDPTGDAPTPTPAIPITVPSTTPGDTPTPAPITTPTPEPIPIKVMVCISNIPGDIGGTAQIQLSDDGIPVTNAVVTVNSIPCHYSAAEEMYSGILNAFTAGTIVEFTITGKGINITEKLIIPEAAQITAPTNADGPYTASEDLTVTWNAFTTAPDYVYTFIQPEYTTSKMPFQGNHLSNTATMDIIPGSTLSAGLDNAFITVVTTNIKNLTGDNYEDVSLFGVLNGAISELFATW